MLILFAVIILLGLYMAWSIGANDVANSMGDAVGSNAISVRNALILAGICEFAGAALLGGHVTDTVRKGIVNPESLAATPEVLALGMTCALLAAAMWLHFATRHGMPVSTTHSIVGAVAGFGIAAAGWRAVEWGKMGEIVASWFISPVAGIVLGFLFFKIIVWLILGKQRPAQAAVRVWPVIVFAVVMLVAASTLCDKSLQGRSKFLEVWLGGSRGWGIAVAISLALAIVARVFVGRHMCGHDGTALRDQLARVECIFAPLVVVTSCSVAFAHGANDVANAIGPLAAVVDVVQRGTVQMKVVVPMWILLLGGAGIVLGLATYGHHVISTIGHKITQLTPSRAVAANIATAATVLVCTRMKWPISTTHILVGSIFGVGFARGLAAVNRGVAKSIFGSWMVSVPAAALLTVVLFLICRMAGVESILRDLMLANAKAAAATP